MSLSITENRLAHSAFLHERCPRARPSMPAHDSILEQWRAHMMVGETLFATRIQSAGLTMEQFLAIIANPVPDVAGSDEFEGWLRNLDALCAGFEASRAIHQPADAAAASQVASLFWSFLSPFVQLATEKLHARRAGAPAIPPGVASSLLNGLIQRLVPRCTPTLVLELNVARLRGRLRGDTSVDRFKRFVDEELREHHMLRSLIREYPLLYRLLLVVVDQWVDATDSLLSRVHSDAAMLGRTFGSNGDFVQLQSIRMGLSDPHRGGASVAHLTFASGRQLIYKPRSLQVEVAFAEFIHEANGLGLTHPLAVPKALDRQTYGWVEYVEHDACGSRAEVGAFYWRLGCLVAFVHALGGVDFHYENLIASGAQPVLVDLEGLFHPRWSRNTKNTGYVRAQQWLENSVIGTGLLPHATAVVQQRLDLSGLGGKAGQVWPRLLPILKDVGTDEMHVDLGQFTIPPAANRPWLPDCDVDAVEFVDDIVQGFMNASAVIQRADGQFDRMLHRFSDVEVRHIARPTARYGLFLREGWHPDYLRDALARDQLLDKLWAEAEIKPELAALVPSEHADLRTGDIPFFTTRPGSRAVWNSRDECIEDYFQESALSVARRRVAAVTTDEREREATLIRQAVLSVKGEAASRISDAPHSGGGPASRAELLEAAIAIGRHLKDRAILGADDACWIGPVMQKSDHWEWRLAPLGTGLYEGIGGIALLFAQLARLTGLREFDDMALRAVRPLREHIKDEYPTGSIGIGAFSGSASLAYVLSIVGSLRGDEALIDEAIEGLVRLESHVAFDTQFDVLGGAAGCAMVALALHRTHRDPRLLRLASQCGDRLIASAGAQQTGVGWIGLVADQALGGFAHGAAGITWSLLELERALGDDRFGHLADQSLAYERSLFVPNLHAWVDRRHESIPHGFKTAAWCHGAAGVALGRVLSLRRRDDRTLRDEVAIAVRETLRQGFDGNHCLCHGGLGNIEIVLLAADCMGEPEWRAVALSAAGDICRAVSARNWKCGLPGRVESPAFMTGLSGIAYSLLRLAAPDSVVAPLWLEMP